MARKHKYPYVYKPGVDDLVDPQTRWGSSAIEPGARVRRIVVKVNSMTRGFNGRFALIADEQGNVQTVWRRAIVKADDQ